MSDDLFEREFSKDTVFKDEATLDHAYLPNKLPRREKEVARLIHDFRTLIAQEDNIANMSINVLITGKGGIGKTATSRYFCDRFTKNCRKSGHKVMHEYFNCLEHRTKSAIYRNLLSKYCYQTGKGYSDDETIKQLEAFLRREKAHLILILDEVHMIPPADVQAFVNLGETLGAGHSRFSTILISRQLDWAKVRNQHIESRLKDKIQYTPYSFDDLLEILTYRCDLAFKEGAVPEEVLKLVVEIAADTKDARHGIDILFQAGKKADFDGESQVTAEMVRLVKDRVYSTFRIDALDRFKDHELISALGVARALKPKDITYILVEDGYDLYKIACEERSIEPHTITSFRKYVRNLSRFKIIMSETVQVEDSKRGRHSRITLYDIPATKLEEILTKIIDNK